MNEEIIDIDTETAEPTELLYKVYIFEINKGSRKLFIQYSTEHMQKCFEKFVRSVRHGKKPAMLIEKSAKIKPVKTEEEAKALIAEQVTILTEKNYQVIAGAHLQKDFWQMYVIELDNNPKKVYVGQSIYNPDIRLAQHISGYNSSVKVRKAKDPVLRPDLYENFGVIKTKEEARAAEMKLAEDLRHQGFTVYGARQK
jgi:hypothetical protein